MAPADPFRTVASTQGGASRGRSLSACWCMRAWHGQIGGPIRSLLVLALCALPSAVIAGWWTEVPSTEEENVAITRLAKSKLHPEYSDVDFHSVTIRKQEIEYEIGEQNPKSGRTESLSLYGTFPDSYRTDDYRERHAIRCEIYAEFVEAEVTKKRESCEQRFERYLNFEGVTAELRLDNGVSLDLARAYLKFLSTQIGPVRGQPLITRSDFSDFERIGVRPGRPKRVVVYWSGGSTTYGISFEVKGSDEYQFDHMQDESFVVD